MKIHVEVRYNGKKFSSIENATFQAVIDSMRESMEEDIQPFADEIAKEGGKITLNLSGTNIQNIKGEMQVSNVSDDLKKRILAAQ